MAYKVRKNPFKSNDYQVFDADSYKEDGSFTKFYLDGNEVGSLPTKLITGIEVVAP